MTSPRIWFHIFLRQSLKGNLLRGGKVVLASSFDLVLISDESSFLTDAPLHAVNLVDLVVQILSTGRIQVTRAVVVV
jgi:hypothetical protein